jgi:hypothetical protein
MNTIAIALILTVAATTAAAASDADMRRCAAITARDARLDCYDALAHQLSTKAAAPTAIPATPQAAAPAVSPAATAASASSAAPASSAATAAPAAVVAGDPKNFGLTPVQQHTVDAGPKMITANISILSSDQKGATFIVLDNGETWSVADSDGWLATGQAVRIKRAAMGSFLMLIPSNHSYHVRRLK